MNRINRTMEEILMDNYGMDISMFDKSFVNKTILQQIEVTGCADITEYGRFVAENKKEAEKIKSMLQVSYSEFFRNTFTFSVLESIVLPRILFNKQNSKSKEIRIWSAACAGGQEPYSLAIILENLKVQNQKISYRIFGTDQDENQLSWARKGQYSKESVANVRQKHLEKWFTKAGNSFAVVPGLKKHCEFYVFNLLGEHSSPPESIYGEFDLVICANILFYYNKEFQKKIIDKITHSLADNGFLVVGEPEREILISYGLKEIYPYTAIFKLKNLNLL